MKKIYLLIGMMIMSSSVFSKSISESLLVNANLEKFCIFYYDNIYELGRVESPATNTTFNLDKTIDIPFGYKCTKDTSFTMKMINDTWQESIIRVTGIKMSSATTNDFLSGIIKDLDMDLNIHHNNYPKTYVSNGEKKVFNWNFRVENPVRTSGKMPQAGYYSGNARFEINY